MSLALVGPESIEELQRLAVSNFAAVPFSDPPLAGASAAYDSLPLPFSPAEAPPQATVMVPVNELRSLKIAWCLPVVDLDGWIASKPEEVRLMRQAPVAPDEGRGRPPMSPRVPAHSSRSSARAHPSAGRCGPFW